MYVVFPNTSSNMNLSSRNGWSWFLFVLLVQYTKGAMSTVTDVQFVNATLSAIGMVQVKYNNVWIYICRNGADYAREASVICRELDYVGGWSRIYTVSDAEGVEINCRLNDKTLSSCEVENDPISCTDFKVIGVWCNNDTDAQLVDGPNERPNIGRVQVKYNNTWTDVCFQGTGKDRDWDHTHNNLKVICQQLGYPGALFSSNVTKDNLKFASDNIVEDYVCLGDEAILNQCYSDPPRRGRCAENFVQVGCARPGYVGCFPLHRDSLTGMQLNTTMTTQTCVDYCRDHPLSNVRYVGLQNGDQCFCYADELQDQFQGSNAQSDSYCDYTCSGDEYDVCGGADSISVHDVTLGNCGDHGIPSNGSFKDNTSFHFGSIVTFVCNPGFLISGSPTIQCVLGRMPNEVIWNSTNPTCEAIPTTIQPTSEVATAGEPNSGVIIGASVGATLLVITAVVLILLYVFINRKSVSQGKNKFAAGMETRANTDPSLQDEDYQSVQHPPDDNNQSYICLTKSSRPPESDYQGIVNPDNLKNTDEYLSLDATSRQVESEYQDLNQKTPDDTNRIYNDIDENRSGSHDYVNSLEIPIPPPVIRETPNSSGPYVNVKANISGMEGSRM